MIAVLDASTVVCWVIEQSQTPAAVGLRERDPDAAFFAPSAFVGEFCQALLKPVRRGESELAPVLSAIEEVLGGLGLTLVPPALGRGAASLAADSIDRGVSYYDVLYIDAARRLAASHPAERVELWTVDEALRRAAQRAGISAPGPELAP